MTLESDDAAARSALVAVAAQALAEVATELVRPVLVSRHRAPDGASLGLAVLRSEIDESLGWAVLAVEIAGGWSVVNACGLELNLVDAKDPYELHDSRRHYGKGPQRSVVVAWNRNPQGVTALRGEAVVADALAVHPDLVLVVSWDAQEVTFHSWVRPRGLEACVQGSAGWQAVADLPRTLVTLEAFLAGYRRHALRESRGDDADYWAWDALFLTAWDAPVRLGLIRRLIEGAAIEEEALLGGLGAGPLEDMASDWLLDQLGPRILDDQRWLYALAMVRDFSSGGPLTERFSRLLTNPMRQWLNERELNMFPVLPASAARPPRA